MAQQPSRATPGTLAKESGQRRIESIDALRGFAALAVVLHHLTRRFFEDYGQPAGALPPFPIAGFHGVFLFFIISGFVISQTLERTSRGRDFLVSRFSRIYPTFWVAVVLTYGLVSAFGLPGREVRFTDALVNLTMLQDYFDVPQVDYVYWSLTIELTFYAIAWAAHARRWLGRRPHALAWAWLAYSAAYVIARRAWGIDLPPVLKLLTLPGFAPLFVAGLTFHHIYAGRGTRQSHAVIACCFILHNSVNWYGKTGLALSAGMFACFYLIAHGRLTFLRARPLVFLGAISYPLYLLHNNVGMIAIRELMAAGVGYNAALGLAILQVLGLAAAVTFFVERPAMRWIRSRMKPAPAAA